ncbi:MAG TPA: alpha/beta hydrolase [Solirubrobacterales bacterium]|nr:alpha/beta hydrolase [Solirubrobacterales bacterium]
MATTDRGEISTGEVAANGLTFGTLEVGSGPLALCLHGFPDSAHTWRHLLPALADAGFRAVAPFMRGYAPTDVPADGCFSTGALIADVDALHDALEADENAVLIGHDWGAIAAYGAGAHAPARWRRLVTLAIPPPALDPVLAQDFEQLKMFFYGFIFLMPEAEELVAADGMAFLDRLWAEWSPGYDATGDMDHVRACLGDPANLAAALGYYRASMGAAVVGCDDYATQQTALGRTAPQPTLYLHGERDGCVSSKFVAAAAEHLAAGSRASIVDSVGHFLHLEQPERIDESILSWLTD